MIIFNSKLYVYQGVLIPGPVFSPGGEGRLCKHRTVQKDRNVMRSLNASSFKYSSRFWWDFTNSIWFGVEKQRFPPRFSAEPLTWRKSSLTGLLGSKNRYNRWGFLWNIPMVSLSYWMDWTSCHVLLIRKAGKCWKRTCSDLQIQILWSWMLFPCFHFSHLVFSMLIHVKVQHKIHKTVSFRSVLRPKKTFSLVLQIGNEGMIRSIILNDNPTPIAIPIPCVKRSTRWRDGWEVIDDGEHPVEHGLRRDEFHPGCSGPQVLWCCCQGDRCGLEMSGNVADMCGL